MMTWLIVELTNLDFKGTPPPLVTQRCNYGSPTKLGTSSTLNRLRLSASWVMDVKVIVKLLVATALCHSVVTQVGLGIIRLD
jgi:hypothetical protein